MQMGLIFNEGDQRVLYVLLYIRMVFYCSFFAYVIKQFKSSPDKARKKIGRRLERLRDYRVLADYQDAVSELPDKTEEALTLARRIIAGLDGL